MADPTSRADYVSEKLAEAGIPGIRYLDQGSRGIMNDARIQDDSCRTVTRSAAKDSASTDRCCTKLWGELGIVPPSYNYVVTDPSKLDILAKYGIVGGTAGGIGSVVDPSRYQETY